MFTINRKKRANSCKNHKYPSLPCLYWAFYEIMLSSS